MSEDYEWGPLHNTFESNTRNSHKKTLKLGMHTDAALHNEMATPEIGTLYGQYHPVYIAYQLVDQNYRTRKSMYRSATATTDAQFDLLTELKIRQWEGTIRAKYIEDSPEELRFFPNKRAPFQQGGYASRIQAVKSLHEVVVADGTFPVAFAVDILSTATVLESSRLAQLEDEDSFKQLADLRDNQRELLCMELYAVLGGLIQLYKADTDQIARFFDIELLHRAATDANLTVSVVKDADGLPLEGAVVLVKNVTTSEEETVITGVDGAAEFELEADEYEITVSLAGYVTQQSSVELSDGEDEVLEVRLVNA